MKNKKKNAGLTSYWKPLVIKKKFLLILFVVYFTSFAAVAQQRAITGTVTDANRQPLPGVTVMVKGTTQGTVTNTDGNYTLSNVPEDATLVFSFVGMRMQEVNVRNQTNVNAMLAEEAIGLEEVIAVGYGTREKGRLTGAISNIDGTEIEQSPTVNLQQSIQGRMPGLKINDRGGEPGREGMEMLIRGKSTLGNNSPLIVIDGVPRSSFSDINPEDIEGISVLKDASAAIYGARAANGVILVTTRRGKSGTSEVSINANYGLSSFIRLPKLMSSYQYVSYLNEIDERYGRTPVWDEEDLQKFQSGNYPLTHPSTDWYKETFNNYVPQTKYDISANGGTEQVKYYISGEYLHKSSMYQEGDMYYDRFQIRSNLDVQVSKFLSLGIDLLGRLREVHAPSYSPLYEIPQAKPYAVSFYPNGLPGDALVGINHRILTSDKGGWDEDNIKEFRSKLSFDQDMAWLTRGLSMKGYAAFDYDINNSEYFANTYKVYTYNETTDEYVEGTGLWKYRELEQSTNLRREHLYHIRLEYDRTFADDHNFTGFIAYEQNDGFLQYLEGYRRDLISDMKVDLWAGSTLGQTTTGNSDEWGRVNYFGSLGYDYKRKYLIDFTLRHDGSFNFPKKGRFGTFPSVSVGWTISEEAFFNKNLIDHLKLRASLAEMGNDLVSSFQYLTKYGIASSYYGWYVFGESPTRADGLLQTNIPNPNITWETATTWNIGADAILFDKKLTASIDYFYEKRRDILIKRTASIPDYTALSLPDENLGKVDNTGMELILNYQNNWNEFGYNLGGNFQYNKNKVVYIDEAMDVPVYRKAEGNPIDSYVLYKTDGIFNSQEEIDNTEAVIPGTKPGDVKYVDVNEDGQITGADQYRTKFGRTPRVQYGINLGFTYKSFGVNAFFHGQSGSQNMIRYSAGATKTNLPEYFFTQRWTPENTDAKYPSAYQGNDTYTSRYSDFWLYDASFLSLQNLSITYNLPTQLVSNINFKNVQLYIQGHRLWYIWDGISARTGTKDYNPEMGTGPGSSNPEQYYPQQRLFNIGITITL